MKKWTMTGVVALLLCGGLAGDARTPKVEAGVDVPALIDEVAGYFHMAEWARQRAQHIAFCESRYDPLAFNRRSGATGVYQFIPSTAWAQGINPWDVYQNVYAALRLMAAGQWQHWRACL